MDIMIETIKEQENFSLTISQLHKSTQELKKANKPFKLCAENLELLFDHAIFPYQSLKITAFNKDIEEGGLCLHHRTKHISLSPEQIVKGIGYKCKTKKAV